MAETSAGAKTTPLDWVMHFLGAVCIFEEFSEKQFQWTRTHKRHMQSSFSPKLARPKF